MKNIKFIALIALIMGGMTMKAQDYHPIVEDGKQWNVLFTYPWTPPESPHRYTDIYKIEGDTLLDGVSYKVMYTTRNEDLTDWSICGTIRETEDKQVFYRRNGASDEQMLYDFSMEVGDTIFMYGEYMVVVEKGETVVNGEPRQQIVLEYPWGNGEEEVWIEGIGSLYGIIDSGSLFLVGGSTDLLCYYEDDDLIWQNSNPNWNSCYIVYSGGGQSGLVVTPTVLTFDEPAVPQTFTISNQYDINVTITSIYVQPDDSIVLVSHTNLPQTIQPGGSMDVEVELNGIGHKGYSTYHIYVLTSEGTKVVVVRVNENAWNSFAPQGAEWYFHVLSQGPITEPPFYYIKKYVTGIEEVQGHTCSVIDGYELVYEEDGVVYWYNPSDDVFTVLYDFNAEAGESWYCEVADFMCLVTVDSVGSVTWDGHTYRTQYVTGYNDDYGIVLDGRIIEGIGYEKGLFPRMEFDGPEYEYMRCYLVDGEMLYHEGDYDCDEEAPVSTTFQSGNLLYDIISTNPPHVSVAGHVDGTNAQGELIIPETVEYEGVTYTVTKIGYEAFYNCSGLTGNLVIPSTVDTIMTRAFKCCSGFTGNLVIPNSVRHLGGGAFEFCYGFDGTLVLPEAIPAIYSYTFEGCTGLTGTLNIPSTVTSIGPAAFGYCTGFTGTLVIPESVVELSTPVPPVNGIRGAFEECTGFTGLVLPESLRIIGGGNGGGCFAYCTGFTGELVIPDKVKVIGHSAFYDCTGLTGELHLPDSLQSIGYEAFALCSGLTGRLVFPDALETIDNEAFVSCSGFTEVDLNHQVFYQNNFGDAVFAYWSMESLELPEGWTTTGKYTFKGCSNLRTVHLPESLMKIDYDCFQDCSSLTDINIPENVTIIESGAFDGCSSLTSLELPANLSQLGGFALRNCTSLTGELVVPDRVELIQQLTFAGCTNLDRIVLGSSVNTINDNAFKDMELDTLVIKTMTPPVMRHFPNQGLSFDQLVIVPCGTMEAYQNAEGWSEFTNITEDCGSGLIEFHGSEWYYEIVDEFGNVTYQHLEYVADTTVNNKDVQIIIRTNTLYDKGEHQEVTREYLYLEDEVVYWWNSELMEFTVLYDLGAQPGDSWVIKVGTETLTMHVDAVNQYYYEGQLFRMLRVSDEGDLFSGTIVCGVGHLSSFFPERLMTRSKGYRVNGLRCYWSYGDLVFTVDRDNCDAIYVNLHNGIEEPTAVQFAIYPNPTNGVLFVETHGRASRQDPTYRITNLMGQTLMSGTITAETQQIDVSNLPQGMYFITIGEGTRKFVVTL